MSVTAPDLEADNRQLQRTVAVMRETLEDKDVEIRRKVQKAEATYSSEISTLKDSVQALRDQMDEERRQASVRVQRATQAGAAEIGQLKDTTQALRDTLEEQRAETQRLVQKERQAGTAEIAQLKDTAQALRDTLEEQRRNGPVGSGGETDGCGRDCPVEGHGAGTSGHTGGPAGRNPAACASGKQAAATEIAQLKNAAQALRDTLDEQRVETQRLVQAEKTGRCRRDRATEGYLAGPARYAGRTAGRNAAAGAGGKQAGASEIAQLKKTVQELRDEMDEVRHKGQAATQREKANSVRLRLRSCRKQHSPCATRWMRSGWSIAMRRPWNGPIVMR